MFNSAIILDDEWCRGPTYLLLVLPDQYVLVVDDHSLEEVLSARDILRDESLCIRLLLLLAFLTFHSLPAGDGRQGLLLLSGPFIAFLLCCLCGEDMLFKDLLPFDLRG